LVAIFFSPPEIRKWQKMIFMFNPTTEYYSD
jgi:hypothetical protein